MPISGCRIPAEGASSSGFQWCVAIAFTIFDGSRSHRSDTPRTAQEAQIGTCSVWSTFAVATTGERRPVATASQPDGPSVQTPHDSSSLYHSFAPPTSLSRVSSASLHRRVSAVSNASCRPKSKQILPMVTAVDLAASRTVSGGVGDEERAPINDHFDGLGRTLEAEGSGQCARLRSPKVAGGGAGLAPVPMQAGRTAGGRLGRHVAAHRRDASAVCCTARVTDVCTVDSAIETMTSPG